MRTITCSLTFADGQVVTATLSAESPQGRFPVRYAGPSDRLPRRKSSSPYSAMQPHFSTLADELHAHFQATESGQFDTWAQ
jgi:hypothetical protein